VRTLRGSSHASRAERSASGAPVAIVTLAVLVSGCSFPGVPIDPVPAGPPPAAAGDAAPLAEFDAGGAELRAQLDIVAARVADLRLLFETAGTLDAAERDDRAALAEIGARLVELLLGSEEVAADATDDGVADGAAALPGLLPAVAPDRAALGSDDLVTRTITLAGDVGGERSRLVLELVRDPMVGDLGAWQRDPLGVIALVRAAATGAGDVASLDAALLELPGELTRALGYAIVLAERDEPTLLAHAAASGAARMRVVLIAISLADEELARSGSSGTPDNADTVGTS
jgi:hypothetical protein